MREQFEQELLALKQDFDHLFDLTEVAFERASKALNQGDFSLAETVVSEDRIINQQQLDIEMAAALLLVRQQPVTRDLRFIVSILQMSSDLEKIGDYAALIAKALLKIRDHHRSPVVEEKLLDLAAHLHQLLKAVQHLWQSSDESLFRTVQDLERQLIEERKTLSATIRRRMDKEPDLVFGGTYYLSMALHMERMADYLTNICERLVYIETGQLVDKA